MKLTLLLFIFTSLLCAFEPFTVDFYNLNLDGEQIKFLYLCTDPNAVDEVKAFLLDNPDFDIDYIGSPLSIAIETGIDLVKVLSGHIHFDFGGLKHLSPFTSSPLMLALIKYNLKIAEWFIDAGADVFCESTRPAEDSRKLRTILHMACEQHYPVPIVTKLLERGAASDINRLHVAAWDSRSYCLTRALLTKKFDLAKLLLENGANPNVTVNSIITPLAIVHQNGYDPGYSKLLLEHGANPFHLVTEQKVRLPLEKERIRIVFERYKELMMHFRSCEYEFFEISDPAISMIFPLIYELSFEVPEYLD